MKSALVLLLCTSACSGLADDLANKRWTTLDPRPGSPISAGVVLDTQGRIVTAGFDDHHLYRYDLSPRVWSDLGVIPQAQVATTIDAEFGGKIYSVVPTMPAGVLELDASDTWQHLMDFPPLPGQLRVRFGANASIWMTDRNDGTTDLLRWNGSAFEPTGSSFVITYTLIQDDRGNFIADELIDGKRRVSVVSADGTTSTPLFTCGAEVFPYCNGDLTSFHHGDGGVTFINENNGGRVYRIASGSTVPKELAVMPTDGGEGHEYETFNHTIDTAYDGDGNLYATRTPNNGGREVLFVLEAGSTEFKRVIATPGIADNIRVRPDGTVFLVNNSGDNTFYVLE